MDNPSALHHEAAARVWATMRRFVESNAHTGNLRERLGLGRGVGRVKALLLLKDGPLSLGEIAAAHHVDAPYATIIVNKLESLGLVERTLDPADHRRKIVALTPAGRDAVVLADEAQTAPPSPLANLSAADLAQLDGLLAKLT